jgi:hypothetical protein
MALHTDNLTGRQCRPVVLRHGSEPDLDPQARAGIMEALRAMLHDPVDTVLHEVVGGDSIKVTGRRLLVERREDKVVVRYELITEPEPPRSKSAFAGEF